ncbi:Ulp1 protease family protein, partial [Trichodelitschia bisporula]
RYLEHEYLNKNPRSKIILLRPSMSFLLMQTSDPLTLKSALPDFSTSTHIFLPVNNASEVEVAEAGSHWSLLLVSVIDAVAFHYDSLGNDNERHAHTVCDKLEVLLGLRLRFLHMRDAPQQENGSDCGVFVCMVMKHLLLDRLLTAEAEDKVNMTMRDHFVNANGGRKEILKVAEKFRKEGERRRSRSASPFGKSERSKSPPRIGDD